MQDRNPEPFAGLAGPVGLEGVLDGVRSGDDDDLAGLDPRTSASRVGSGSSSVIAPVAWTPAASAPEGSRPGLLGVGVAALRLIGFADSSASRISNRLRWLRTDTSTLRFVSAGTEHPVCGFVALVQRGDPRDVQVLEGHLGENDGGPGDVGRLGGLGRGLEPRAGVPRLGLSDPS